jgi:hypothetical protein
MNLIDVAKNFTTEEACLAHLENYRWPNGVRCVQCGQPNISRITRHSKNKNKRTKLYQCLNCKTQFSATSGTLFNDSHLPLKTWFAAIVLICNGKKGISAKQMQRDLGVSYRTAWYLNHRIRKAMEEGELPQFTGVVEADETYVGGKYDKRRKRERYEKQAVMGIMERGNRVEAFPIPTPSKTVLTGKIAERVSPKAQMVCTDELAAYKSVGKTHNHGFVRHGDMEWVRGEVHTNSVENFWSLFKRGLIGSFHQVSVKHLNRYLAEFTYRFNYRDLDLFRLVLAGLLSKSGMPYKEVVAEGSDGSSK